MKKTSILITDPTKTGPGCAQCWNREPCDECCDRPDARATTSFVLRQGLDEYKRHIAFCLSERGEQCYAFKR